MTRTVLTNLRTIVQGRTAVTTAATNATPIVVTRNAAAAITVVGASYTTPIVINTGVVAHGLQNGDTVTIASVTGNTNANGTRSVLVVDAFNFQIFDPAAAFVPIVGNAAYVSGGTITPWIFVDGDLVVEAGVATNTAANGTWILSGSTSVLSTLLDRRDQTNSVGNGVGTGGTMAHSGSSIGVAVPITAIAPMLASVKIRVRSMSAGASVVFTVQDSVNGFSDLLIIASKMFSGAVDKYSQQTFFFVPRELITARFGVASANLRLRVDVSAGGTCEYDAFLEY